MNIILLFSLSALLSFSGSCVSKLTSNIVGRNNSHQSLFVIVNGVFGSAFFLCFAGFRIQFNMPTALFSLAYGISIILSLIISVKILQLADIALVTVIGSASGIIINFLIGALLFGEQVTTKKVIRVVLMLAAMLVIFAGKKSNSNIKKGFITVMIFRTVIVVINFLITKFYTIAPNVADNNSFFFLTNVVSVLGAAIWFAIDQYRYPISFREHKEFLSLKRVLCFAGNTLCSNLQSLVSMQILSLMEITFYSPISSALGILVGVCSSLALKERLNKYSYISAGIAIIAVVI